MLKVVDMFHTQDGEWYPSDKPYSITKEAAEKWEGVIEGSGAAHHIFVLMPHFAHVTEFNTEDGRNQVEKLAPTYVGGWVSHPIFQSYNPDNGEKGAWLVRIDGEKIAEHIGLPYGWHVSHFFVVEDVMPIPIDAGPGPSVPPVPPVQGGDKIQFIVNGVTIWSN